MNKNNRFVRFSWLATALFFVFAISIPTIAFSQTVPLPPTAQEALDNGIIAAKVPDYVLAIRYFEEARKIAPDAPIIYFNLGLAESKIAGRELRAICWFAAYLATDPKAGNASSVKEQIQILQIRSQSNISHLIKTLQDSMGKDDGRIEKVVKLLAESGDIPTALKTATLTEDKRYREISKQEIAIAQVSAGDIPGAVKTAEMIEDATLRSIAFLAIANIQMENDDLAGAESSIASAKRAADIDKSDARLLKNIGEMQIKAGNMAGAQSTLKAALIAADLIETQLDKMGFYYKTNIQTEIARTQISAGDIEGAKKTLLIASENSKSIKDNSLRAALQGIYIWDYQLQIGDFDGATKTAEMIQDTSLKARAMDEIARNRAKTNSASSPTPNPQPKTLKSLPAPLTSVEWIKKLSDLEANYFVDLPGYLKTLPSDDAYKMYRELYNSVSKMVEQQNYIINALKRQPTEQTK